MIEFGLDEERNVESKMIIFMVTFLIATAMRERTTKNNFLHKKSV